MLDNVTFVLTSCSRPDLLEATIESIGWDLLEKIPHKIIVEDSGNDQMFKYFYQDNPIPYDFDILFHRENKGLVRSIDEAYRLVKTPYVFHCEDDWLFEGEGYIEKAISVLETVESLAQVCFRKDCPHPLNSTVGVTEDGVEYQIKLPNWRNEWYGFTFNPSVVRMDAYRKVGEYFGHLEQEVSRRYYDKGYLSASLVGEDQVVSHSGHGRSTHPYKKTC